MQELSNGMRLLAYPMQSGLLVALGYTTAAERQVGSQELLRRRSENLSRYALWLPAMFADGSLYVVRRLTDADPAADVPPLQTADLMLAVELLS
jgi:hypothetical protein